MQPHLGILAAGAIVAAVESTTAGDLPAQLIASILSTGLIGLMFIDLTAFQRLIVPRRQLDALSAERDRRELLLANTIEHQAKEISELKQLNESLQEVGRDRMIPALVQATESQRSMVDMLGRMAGHG